MPNKLTIPPELHEYSHEKYRHLIIILNNNTDVNTYVNTDEAPTSKNLEKNI